MHALLVRQLKRFFKDGLPTDPRLQPFLEAVSDAYVASEDDRALLEHTLALSSQELEERNAALLGDIETRIRVESESNAFFRLSPDLLGIIGHDMKIRQVNPSWSRALGYDETELLGRDYMSLVHPEDLAHTTQEAGALMQQGACVDFENRFRARNGEWRWISWAATNDQNRGLFYAVARDITRQREMQRELAQAQKLEAVGELASGVAHEINTPMQFIGDNVRFVSDSFADLVKVIDGTKAALGDTSLPAPVLEAIKRLNSQFDLDYLVDEIPHALTETLDGVRRVAELVKALKEFAHPDTSVMEAADINETISRALVLSRGVVKHLARVEVQLDPTLPLIPCQVGLLGQVFLNLIVNAAHAIEDKATKTGNTQLGLITVTSGVVDGKIVVKIGDSGCGIPHAIRERIFEPFFTTKEVGRGSGQGLPLVRSVIVERHGGDLTFDSEVGVGTTFCVTLPVERAFLEQRAA
jgi:two-component system, NtrC family, sensor kinase